MKEREKFSHLTERDRDRIHALYGYGHSQVDIGKVLGVNKGTISRELRRYGKTTWRYNATRAQKDAETKRAHSKRPGMKIEANKRLRQCIIKEPRLPQRTQSSYLPKQYSPADCKIGRLFFTYIGKILFYMT